MDNQTIDFKWFIENRQTLFDEYGDTYLAIKGKRVVGVYTSYAEGVKKTMSKEQLGTFIVQHCTADESGYTEYIYSMNY